MADLPEELYRNTEVRETHEDHDTIVDLSKG